MSKQPIVPSAEQSAPAADHATTSLTDPTTSTGGHAAAAPALPSIAAGRYALGEEIARGGMGAIFRATDTILGREVAVKVLQEKYAPDSGTARRFADEARIAGQLQHPGIPPVHDLGTLPDGRPFLAMKLIKGQNLSQLLAGRTDAAADRGRLVAVFEQVCQALAYAHSHGVVHRDLKPANVMVGAFGEVQVMDWGLAKVLGETPETKADPEATTAATQVVSLRDSDDKFTQTGSVLGTPAYMPPEQAIGAVDQIDARSDVFGLGGLLAVVLTGRPPFESNSAESTRQLAARGKLENCFDRLERCGADPELVALCKRCLSPEKADRPADAAEVATAVAALRTAADERARRAELDKVRIEGEKASVEARALERRKRRRLALVACAALVLAIVAGLASVLLVQQRAKANLETINKELAEQRAEAEARFDLARKAIATFHTGVSEDALLKNREFTELRARLLKEAAGFYGDLEKMLAQKTDAKSQRLLAAGYYDLGQLTDKIGDKNEALAVQRRALALRRELAARPDADAEARLDVVRSLYEISRVLNATGDLAGTMANAQEQRTLAAALLADSPTDPARDALANGYYVMGIVNIRMGKFAEALAAWGKSRDLWQKLVDANPTDAKYRMSLGDSLNGLGVVATETGKAADAIQAYDQAVTAYLKLADAHPDVSKYQMALGRTYNNIATILRESGRPAEALPPNEKARQARQKLVDTHPAVTDYQKDLAITYNDIGAALWMTGKRNESVAALNRALAIQQKLADANPEVPDFQHDLTITLINVSESLAKTQRRTEALEKVKQAVAILQKLSDAYPKVSRYRQHLGNAHDLLGQHLADAGQLDAALASLDKGQMLFEALQKESPGSLFVAIGLGECRTIRGTALKEAGRAKEAAAELRRAVAEWDKVKELPVDARVSRSQALSVLAELAKNGQSGVSVAEGARFADQAVAGLRAAFQAGWAEPAELAEPAFAVLRQRDDFQKLQKAVEAKAAAGRQSQKEQPAPGK